MIALGNILPHVPSRLDRRNLAFDLARGASHPMDADPDRHLGQFRSALALGLRILRAQRREANAEPLHVRRWHGVGSQRCPSCQSLTGHAFWCDR